MKNNINLKIEKLRKQLNKQVSDGVPLEKCIVISKKLDVLINKYYSQILND